jgi:hypothetical protein
MAVWHFMGTEKEGRRVVLAFLQKTNTNYRFYNYVDEAFKKFNFISNEYLARQAALKCREEVVLNEFWAREVEFLVEFFRKKKKDK